jgi:hypothetical protein
VGHYQGFGQEIEVVEHTGALLLLLPSGARKPHMTLLPAGEDTFRIEGSAYDGELLVFQRDATGAVTGAAVGAYLITRKT